jgi:hypothetical protein
MVAVAERFGLALPEPDVVKEIDRRICFSEAEWILHGGAKSLAIPTDPIRDDEWPEPEGLPPNYPELRYFPELHPAAARQLFLYRFTTLMGREQRIA